MLRFREVFEDDRIYNQVFNQNRLRADSRKIILCYKIQFRLRRLVNDIVDNKEAHAIMHAIILLGDALGMRVTVEGVETAAQLALLEREECDEIQGYHISPPRPAGDVAHLLSLPPNNGAVAHRPQAKH